MRDAQADNTIGGAMAEATTRLSAAGVDAPKLVAEVLMAHALGVPRTKILAFPPDQPLQAHQLAAYQAYVARCLDAEPMAYVVGHTEFYGLDFLTDRRALIPRPETEHLVEMALAKAKPASKAQMNVVDVGTGSGCIIVALATQLNDSRVRLWATDISADALALARENARRHRVASRIQFLRGDLLAPVPRPVEGVVANLPYVTTAEWQNLPRNIRNYEPRGALDGGPYGLDPIRRLVTQAARQVKQDGWMLLEIGATQGPAVMALVQRAFPLAAVKLHRDYAGLARVVEIQLRYVPGVNNP